MTMLSSTALIVISPIPVWVLLLPITSSSFFAFVVCIVTGKGFFSLLVRVLNIPGSLTS